jgi:hypothetical protein
METWNREELYREVWKEPMLKLAKKYGISSVMLGKVCRKLSIPVPGRGYWARKAHGYHGTVKPLPKVKDVPVVQRFKFPDPNPKEPTMPEPEPTDEEYLRIKEVESRAIAIDPEARQHPLARATAKSFKQRKADDKGLVSTQHDPEALDLTVSKASFDRAIRILNAVVTGLEREGFPVSIDKESRSPFTTIFGQKVAFDLIEKYRQFKLSESERNDDFLSPRMRYEPSGILEFRVGPRSWGRSGIRDGKKIRLEAEISSLVGACMREARDSAIWEEKRRQEEIKRRQRELELQGLAEQIRSEEKQVANFESWVTSWLRAKQYREFIAALEDTWTRAGHDLSSEGEKGKRITWMKQQADRLDPLIDSPPSILDRKRELGNRWY